ncbi:MAG: hypothetical protein QM765_26685 [Myxococcales bacterium]
MRLFAGVFPRAGFASEAPATFTAPIAASSFSDERLLGFGQGWTLRRGLGELRRQRRDLLAQSLVVIGGLVRADLRWPVDVQLLEDRD